MPFYKYLFIAVLSLSLFSLPAIAQDDEDYEDDYEYEEEELAVKPFRVALGAMYNIPLEETFSLRYNNGLGAIASFGYNFSPAFSLVANTGFLFWEGNEQVLNEQMEDTKFITYYQVPVTLMPMYFFSRGGTYEIYAAIDAGLVYNATKKTIFKIDAPNQEQAFTEDGVTFSFAPVLGAQMGFSDNFLLNVNARYTYVSGAQREIPNTVNLSYIGIYAGLVFEF